MTIDSVGEKRTSERARWFGISWQARYPRTRAPLRFHTWRTFSRAPSPASRAEKRRAGAGFDRSARSPPPTTHHGSDIWARDRERRRERKEYEDLIQAVDVKRHESQSRASYRPHLWDSIRGSPNRSATPLWRSKQQGSESLFDAFLHKPKAANESGE